MNISGILKLSIEKGFSVTIKIVHMVCVCLKVNSHGIAINALFILVAQLLCQRDQLWFQEEDSHLLQERH